MEIGFIGLGRMGQAIAGNLLRAGHALSVWNRSPAAAAALVAGGARLAGDPAATAGGEVLLSMLADDEAHRRVLIDGGVFAAAAPGLIYVNLVDFDQQYGHRNDVEGYARALEEFDAWLPSLYKKLTPQDLLIITADHGCDPTTPSTDHSREYVPLLVYRPRQPEGFDLGVRSTLSDIGQTVAENFGTKIGEGASFLPSLC